LPELDDVPNSCDFSGELTIFIHLLMIFLTKREVMGKDTPAPAMGECRALASTEMKQRMPYAQV